MSAPSSPETDRQDLPAESDGFVRGLSQAIGGPLGDHAVRPGARPGRFWNAQRIILALTCLMLAFSWVQKSPCQDGDWQKNIQYTRFCYTDVLALYYAEGLNEGKVPYKDHPVEYPVVTGYFMGALGLPVHALGQKYPEINQGKWFYNANALVLSVLAVATVAMILALRRRRPWDAAIFALSPILLVTATVNWDFLAIALAIFGLYAWARRWPVLAGILLGLGGAAKLWPLFILGPLVVLALRSKRLPPALLTAASAVVTVVAVNLPIALMYRDSWLRFFHLNDERAIDWGTFWYIGRYLTRSGTPGGRRSGPVPMAQRPHPGPQQPHVRADDPGLRGDRGALPARAAPSPARPGRVPGGRGIPDLQQGLVAAVRALAVAADRAGPSALGGDHRLDGGGDRLLHGVLCGVAGRRH